MRRIGGIGLAEIELRLDVPAGEINLLLQGQFPRRRPWRSRRDDTGDQTQRDRQRVGHDTFHEYEAPVSAWANALVEEECRRQATETLNDVPVPAGSFVVEAFQAHRL